MLLEKAIELLSDSAYNGSTTFNEEFKAATILGIEALKEVRKARAGDPALDGELLPGETDT